MMADSEKYIRENYFGCYSTIKKIRSGLTGVLTVVSVIAVLWLVARMPTNLISWIFFALSTVLLAMIAKSDNKASTLKHIICMSTACKLYAVIVLISELIFTVTIGGVRSPFRGSMDRKFQLVYPDLYSYL